MREILYRGKNAGGDGWIYGVPLDDEIIRNVDGFVVGMKIKPETVCEFTGLTDKNSTKIFEGDILKYISENGKPEYFVVSWNEDPIRYIITETKTGCVDVLDDFVHRKMEVAGNIFDNPEMMEGCEK